MITLFTTAYLPSVSYITECLRSDNIIIEAFETYKKQTCRNHCDIYGPNSKQKLSIPVIKVNGNHTFTKDVRISYSQNWQKLHWRSIETAYNNSPFFLFYRDHLEPFYKKKFDFLLDFNTKLLEVLLIILGIKKEIRFTDHFENAIDSSDNLILQTYTQVFSAKYGFLPNLSIIDLLFNLGPDAREYLNGLSFTTDFTDYTDFRLNH
jgi:hypothetical protein